jgi:hypothetical protein
MSIELTPEELQRIKTALEWSAADYGPADEITMALLARLEDALHLISLTSVFEQDQRP